MNYIYNLLLLFLVFGLIERFKLSFRGFHIVSLLYNNRCLLVHLHEVFLLVYEIQSVSYAQKLGKKICTLHSS